MTNDESEAVPDPHSPPGSSPGEPVVSVAPAAWQPLTPRGVAAFASATFGRLFLVELIVALLAAGAILWFLATAWFPTVRRAIHQLPEQGQIRDRQLLSPRAFSEPLAAGHFLAFVVDLENRDPASLSSDVRVEFHRNSFEVCSLPGCVTFPYPQGWVVEFNRTELEPWWGAWEPFLLGIAAVLIIVALFLTWSLLAACWFGAVRLVAHLGNRVVTRSGSWRLASAALMPGALLMIAGICLYGLRALDLIFLGAIAAFHFILGLVYACVSPLFLPRSPAAGHRPAKNPFATTPAGPEHEDEPRP